MVKMPTEIRKRVLWGIPKLVAAFREPSVANWGQEGYTSLVWAGWDGPKDASEMLLEKESFMHST